MSVIDEMAANLSQRTNTEFRVGRYKNESMQNRYMILTKTKHSDIENRMQFGPFRINDAKRCLAMFDDLLFRQGLQVLPRGLWHPTEASADVE